MSAQNICPRFEKATELLGKRWVALIVYDLMSGPRRFGEIDADLANLSGKMLAERLKELETEGIVKRDVYPETPVRIEYSLTEKGKALEPILGEITKWSSEWIELN
ncbi:MarR family transcriptional regulator [Paenibacillus darwinianus]|uniref:MarR family transcriptional regulator n=1 Tax=Paenibacillus darwinianus TaxID=1380763 RepID=A0A9W5S343_9BACL|nr:winged helix-turn-helix transcriptional regulator [Paenibacillus darwinianus]EXX90195.1 MarR family transcriptional regulator [Paenibacillus darwinianus]EXX90860.1 MarR family transcriptional regulator [Paenibacillus darwinianus]EXX90913.1 MarR family transcriptional regulator [Paenibacillus darwinianus]